jgi:exonuclease V gamma subunit
MGCSIKHGRVEYCYKCSEYPCGKYKKTSEKDSFVSYVKVIEHFDEAQEDLIRYLTELKEKYTYLKSLIETYNDGRSKTFFCTVVNNLDYRDLCTVMEKIHHREELDKMMPKERTKEVVRFFRTWAEERGVVFVLRK